MGSASFVFWWRTARSRRSGHQCSLRITLRELCVTAPCIGEAVSVLVDALPPCGTGHFISVDIFAPSFLLPWKPVPRWDRAGGYEFWLSPAGGSALVVDGCFCSLRPAWNFFRSVSE